MQTATDTANAELLSKFSDAFNSHNVGALMACMTEDCVFDAVGGSEVHGVRFEGQAAVAKAFEQVWISMPDAQWLDGNHWATGERGVSEWTFTGTDAEGARMEAQGCDLFTFRDGKIAVKQAFRKSRPLIKAEK